MTVGSLFSGIGGLELALESFGHTVIWQAESDPYALAVLAKHWPSVKRYEDVREIDERAERPDIICGGCPCQDISVAGKRTGIDGERSGLWSEFARIVRVLRPEYVFVENVAALLARGVDRVLGDLAQLGYDAEWGVFRASDAGAPHLRARIFILAHRVRGPLRHEEQRQERGRLDVQDGGGAESRHNGANVADGHGDGPEGEHPQTERQERYDADGRGEGVAHEIRAHLFPPGPDRIAGWSGPKPGIRRDANGLSGRLDRLRCLGNAVVPQQAALAWETLMRAVTP